MVGNMDYAAVTMAVRRFEAKAERDKVLRSQMTKLKDEVSNVPGVARRAMPDTVRPHHKSW